MNNVINLPTLISKLASASGVDLAVSRRFLHELFAQIQRGVATGETVDVEGIGQFAKGFSADKPVLFRLDEGLAAVVNEPFSAFQPVELNEGAEKEIEQDNTNENSEKGPAIEEKKEVETPINDTDEDTNTAHPIVEEEKAEEPVAETPTSENENGKIEGEKTTDVPVANVIPAPETPVSSQSKNVPPVVEPKEVANSYIDPQIPQNHSAHSSSHTLWLVLGIMIGVIIGLVGGYFAGKAMGRYESPYDEYEDDYDEDITELVETINEENKDVNSLESSEEPIVEAETAVQPKEEVKQPEPVYANVTSTLTQLAREQYGDKNYWVFIFKANPSLKNPNQIAPGTKVLIPPYESFAGATREETNLKAKEILNELSKQYKL